MFKEAVMWAALVTGIVCSNWAFLNFKDKKLSDKGVYLLIWVLFVGIFCTIYLLFRVFHYLFIVSQY
jgi:hypothetical protein